MDATTAAATRLAIFGLTLGIWLLIYVEVPWPESPWVYAALGFFGGLTVNAALDLWGTVRK